MADLRIVDAPVLLKEMITGDVKMPTGGLGNYAIRLGDLVWYIVTKEQLTNKSYVDQQDDLKADKATTYTKDETYSREEVDNKDGDLTTLKTTDKTNLVKAINEVHDTTKGVVALYGKNVETGVGENGWDANLVTYGEITQKQINDGLDSVAAMLAIEKPRNGQRVYVKSYHAGLNKGGGTFVYDATKLTINDGGVIINGWVRQIESDYYLEFWGVVSDNTDQATKIQKAIDYCQANNVKKLVAMGKDDYIINSTLVFKPTPTKVNWGYGDDRFVLDLNGGNLKTTNDNLTFIKLLRDHVKLVNVGIFGTYGKKQRAVVFGYDFDETHVPNTRESVMWCELDNIKLGGLDIGLQFNPNYGAYGMYYHRVNNIDARDVTILFYGEHTTSTQADIDAGRGSNKVTRSNFTNITHNKGACSIFFKDIETCYFDIYAEDITKDDSRLPDGKAVFAYIPKAQDYNNLAYDNMNNKIEGSVEVVTRVFNFGQTSQGVEWAVAAMGVKEDLPTAYINPHLAVDIRNKARQIQNQSLDVRVNPAAIIARPVTMLQSNTAQSAKDSYPKPDVDNYGSLISIASTHEWSSDQFQLFASQTDKEINGRFNFGDWFQFITTANSYGLGSSWKMLENKSLNDFRFQGGGLRIAQVLFSNGDATVAQSMPRPNHVYGAVLWVHGISPKNFDGFQILLSIDPLNIYFRAVIGGNSLTTGTWTTWKTISAY